MRMVKGRKSAWGSDFGNRGRKVKWYPASWMRLADMACPELAEGSVRPTLTYSRTLSSSFFLPQSAAAWTKARTSGCGFFSVDDSCGWNKVAT